MGLNRREAMIDAFMPFISQAKHEHLKLVIFEKRYVFIE